MVWNPYVMVVLVVEAATKTSRRQDDVMETLILLQLKETGCMCFTMRRFLESFQKFVVSSGGQNECNDSFVSTSSSLVLKRFGGARRIE